MNVYIEQTLSGQFIVCKSFTTLRYRETKEVTSKTFLNIFGKEINNKYDKHLNDCYIVCGEALTSGFKTIEQAKAFIKENKYYETYAPHTKIYCEI